MANRIQAVYDLSNDTFKLVKEIKDEGFKSSPGIMVLFFQSLI